MDALKGDGIEAEFEGSKGKRIDTGDRGGHWREMRPELVDLILLLDHGARLKVAGGERDRLGLGVEMGLKLELDNAD